MSDALYTILLSIIPGALYAFVIWLTIPFMSFNLRTSYQYVLLGCISVGLVMFVHQYLPFLYSDPITVMISTQMGDIEFLKNMAFYEVGITEEVSKLLTFILICRVRRLTDSNDDSRNDSPIATMVYCAMVSLGFAIIENAHYASNYGSDILIPRLFTAVLVHMELGLMMGYWLALAKIDNTQINRSVMSIIFKKHKNFKTIVYGLVGLSTAVFVHGLYDFNLFVFSNYGAPLMYAILGLGAFITYIGANHLIALTKK
jgi:RsiW-degrading membrane proteinase PrsW (M82 family)